ncbi:MAG TPA: hypothetical protein VFN35_10085 [Ktedonobacteraceae bacterium]|nr:hypothetical protein [Ktedonobacteraceae bacterium]
MTVSMLMDASIALDFSRGGLPVCLATEQERGSVGVRIQQAFPNTKVVKALNTKGSQEHRIDDAPGRWGSDRVPVWNGPGAKEIVSKLLRSFGWRDIRSGRHHNRSRHGNDDGHLAAVWATERISPCNWKLVR